ncbi:MAG: hypothetical protein H8E38_04170 [SAR324 cluster bacterium]|nr:hypothetical protein [SAR324 cluster bacterium]MBL7035270.1 hypothetical protein [SAR324 cluster bacterium]
MFNNFEPQEKKAILIFMALLVLGLVYLGTHDLNLGNTYEPYVSPLPTEDESSSGRFL